MSDLETRIGVALRTLADGADGYAAPPPARVAARAERIQRAHRLRVGIASGVVALLVALAGSVLAGGRGADRVPATTVDGASTTAPAATTPTSTIGLPPPTSAGPGGTAAPGTTVGPEAGSEATPESWVPAPTDRVATLPAAAGWAVSDYHSQGPGNGRGETYLGAPRPDGRRPLVMVRAFPLGAGSTCAGAAIVTDAGPDTSFHGARCVGDWSVSLEASGLPRATVGRLLASLGEDDPTRLDLTGTDLASVHRGADQEWLVQISYDHPSEPGLQLLTMKSFGFDLGELALSSGAFTDARRVDLGGVSAVEYHDSRGYTMLTWAPSPELVVTMTVGAASDRLPAIAGQVVLRPGAAVHRDYVGRSGAGSSSGPGTTTTTMAAGPPAGLASIAVLPASGGWTATEYRKMPPAEGVSELYAGPVRADGDRTVVIVSFNPFSPDVSCSAGGPIGSQDLTSARAALVGSRCVGGGSVVITGRNVSRDLLARLLASVTDDAPTELDVTGTGLVSFGLSRATGPIVTVGYVREGWPGEFVTTSPDPGGDPLERQLLASGPTDAERIDLDGVPALRSRSIVEGNLVWTTITWRPAPGLLVTAAVFGGADTDRAVELARQVVLRPAAVVDAELRSLPPFAPRA